MLYDITKIEEHLGAEAESLLTYEATIFFFKQKTAYEMAT